MTRYSDQHGTHPDDRTGDRRSPDRGDACGDTPAVGGRVALRGPAELADALPYLIGFHPDDSIVLIALHGERGRFGGRLRLGIPESVEEWPAVCAQLASCLAGSAQAGGAARPDGALVFLCRDPAPGESGREVMERLRPLAQRLRTACGELEMPVHEALCLSGGRYWSYCCPDPRCCPAEGAEIGGSGTSVMAAAAACAGIAVQGSLAELESRLQPPGGPAEEEQERALDTVASELMPPMLRGEADAEAVREATCDLAERVLERFGAAPPVRPREGASAPGRGFGPPAWEEADARDDALLTGPEAARLIIGLQDRVARDRAAEWMEGDVAQPALRLWRALARRCAGAYADHAAAPLALAGWVAWSTGDEVGARVALGIALRLDPEYLFAQLLHAACNKGLDPEPLRRCMRQERAARCARSPADGTDGGT